MLFSFSISLSVSLSLLLFLFLSFLLSTELLQIFLVNAKLLGLSQVFEWLLLLAPNLVKIEKLAQLNALRIIALALSLFSFFEELGYFFFLLFGTSCFELILGTWSGGRRLSCNGRSSSSSWLPSQQFVSIDVSWSLINSSLLFSKRKCIPLGGGEKHDFFDDLIGLLVRCDGGESSPFPVFQLSTWLLFLWLLSFRFLDHSSSSVDWWC